MSIEQIPSLKAFYPVIMNAEFADEYWTKQVSDKSKMCMMRITGYSSESEHAIWRSAFESGALIGMVRELKYTEPEWVVAFPSNKEATVFKLTYGGEQ